MEEFQFELLAQLGTVSANSRGWTRELSVIRWNGRAPKYDLRDWSPDKLRMSKGITLTPQEIRQLRDILNTIPLEEQAASDYEADRPLAVAAM
jgi:hypothetical protein